MTVPGVYRQLQGGKGVVEIAMANMVERASNAGRVDIGIVDTSAFEATIRAAAESDGVVPHALVAFAEKVAGMGIVSPYFNMAGLAQEARDALRALEGE